MANLSKRFPRYSKLLRLYPPAYRKQYRGQILQTLADMLDDPQSSKTKTWIRTSVDLPLSIAKQQIISMGEIMTFETPVLVKRAIIAAAALLTPFFIFLTLDAITAHSLYSSWFWEKWVASTWLVFMPAAAFLIAFVTFIYWYREQKKSSFWKRLFDFRHNWPMIAVAIISLGIIVLAFGHDSVHCVTNNPVKEIRDWHTTVRCIETG